MVCLFARNAAAIVGELWGIEPMMGRGLLFLLLLAGPCPRGGRRRSGDCGQPAAMLRAGRAVVSANQDRINDPAKGQDGLDGPGFLAQAVVQFKQATGEDPAEIDPASRAGRLLHMGMDAIVEVIDANQPTLKASGPTFKGFIPAIFSRLVGEGFSRRASGEAEMRVTAPPDLVRNRKARPDPWELQAITSRFQAADWPKGGVFRSGG
jgi:hypothetical protein